MGARRQWQSPSLIWGGKTQKERLVPIPEQFREVLLRRRAEAPEGAVYVFAVLNGKPRANPSEAIPQGDQAGRTERRS
jgi:integrase